MASYNKVILMGNLTKDPEVRYTPSGTAVGDVRLAVNRKFKGNDGQEKDETCFVGVTVWGRQAETCGEYLKKGSPVLVEGRLKLDEWEKDGQKHSRLGVVGERVQFLSGPKTSEFRDSPPPPARNNNASAAPQEGPPAGDMVDDDNLPF